MDNTLFTQHRSWELPEQLPRVTSRSVPQMGRPCWLGGTIYPSLLKPSASWILFRLLVSAGRRLPNKSWRTQLSSPEDDKPQQTGLGLGQPGTPWGVNFHSRNKVTCRVIHTFLLSLLAPSLSSQSWAQEDSFGGEVGPRLQTDEKGHVVGVDRRNCYPTLRGTVFACL